VICAQCGKASTDAPARVAIATDGTTIPFCSPTCLCKALRGQAQNKYYAKRAWSEMLQRWFQSQHERAVCEGLRLREQAGQIAGLAFQVPFDLAVNGHHVCRYVADATYQDTHTGHLVVVDAKSPATRTAAYKIKSRLLFVIHGITIEER